MHHEHDAGLAEDLRTLAARRDRRTVLRLLGAAGLIPWLGCGGAVTEVASGACAVVPEETQGPYPGDGSNGVNALALSGIVRSDLRASLAGGTGVAAGVPLTVKLTLTNANTSCAPLAGYAIYVWHCDQNGKYSLYDVKAESYLRGVQETDASGTVVFETIFPGCYSGRMPHLHVEVYPSLAAATDATKKVKTSQLAFPRAVCDAVYATGGYSASVANFAKASFARDMVFNDGVSLQLATVTETATNGYEATLSFGIAA